jgi:hypothetical protein
MSNFNINIYNGKVSIDPVMDIMETILRFNRDNSFKLASTIHRKGVHSIFSGTKSECNLILSKVKKYAKVKNKTTNANEYNEIANNLFKVEKKIKGSHKASNEIKKFKSSINQTKVELKKYLRELGIKSYELSSGNFDSINDEFTFGHEFDDSLIETMSKNSIYNEQELKERIFELEESNILILLEN